MEAPRSPLGGRYEYSGSYRTADGTVRWSALDGETGNSVLVAVVPSAMIQQLEAIRGEKHLHLAAVLDVLREADAATLPARVRLSSGAAIAVAELVPGPSLRGQLKRGRIHPFKAVAWVLRLADAVATIHDKGSFHGSISPRSVVVEPVGRAIAPVLAQLVAPPLAAFCSPARLQGCGPSQEDDVWALHAVLYTALTGSPPFTGNGDLLLRNIRSGKVRPLKESGLDEPILQRILDRGLAPDAHLRTTDITTLNKALDAWERGKEPAAPAPKAARASESEVRVAELFFDDGMLPDEDAIEVARDGGAAPPEPSAGVPSAIDAAVTAAAAAELEPPADAGHGRPAAPPFVARAVVPAHRDKGRSLMPVWLGLAALVVLLAGVAAVLLLAGAGEQKHVAPPATSSSAGAAASSVQGGKPHELTPSQQTALCVQSFFEEGEIPKNTLLDFVCGDDDFRDISTRLFQVAAPARAAADAGHAASSAGIVVTASGNAGDLGWYELAATAMVRATCCPRAAPVTLPQTSGWCQQLQGEVRAIAEASKKPVDMSPRTRKFEDAVLCLYATGTKRPYRYDKAPSPAETQAFQRFLKHAAESEVQRSRMRWLDRR